MALILGYWTFIKFLDLCPKQFIYISWTCSIEKAIHTRRQNCEGVPYSNMLKGGAKYMIASIYTEDSLVNEASGISMWTNIQAFTNVSDELIKMTRPASVRLEFEDTEIFVTTRNESRKKKLPTEELLEDWNIWTPITMWEVDFRLDESTLEDSRMQSPIVETMTIHKSQSI